MEHFNCVSTLYKRCNTINKIVIAIVIGLGIAEFTEDKMFASLDFYHRKHKIYIKNIKKYVIELISHNFLQLSFYLNT